MSEQLTERQKIRELRGAILRSVQSVYGRQPDTVSLGTMRHHVLGQARRTDPQTERQFALALGYLTDPLVGCVERIELKRDALDDEPLTFYRLTAAGLRILNGEATDVGVEL